VAGGRGDITRSRRGRKSSAGAPYDGERTEPPGWAFAGRGSRATKGISLGCQPCPEGAAALPAAWAVGKQPMLLGLEGRKTGRRYKVVVGPPRGER
jgi:hypothetical protein